MQKSKIIIRNIGIVLLNIFMVVSFGISFISEK